MTELRWTDRRHRMLAEANTGQITDFNGTWEWANHQISMLTDEARALTTLRNRDLIQVAPSYIGDTVWKAVDVTDTGRDLLAAWTAERGCPLRGIGDHDCVEHEEAS